LFVSLSQVLFLLNSKLAEMSLLQGKAIIHTVPLSESDEIHIETATTSNSTAGETIWLHLIRFPSTLYLREFKGSCESTIIPLDS
jgi:hypothetical protein